MVVWLFAGGGESEIRGLIPFLQKNFKCTFERKTPIYRKPGPKPTKKERPTSKKDKVPQGYGKTSSSLLIQLKRYLNKHFSTNHCDLILVIDDLDCRDFQQQKQNILAAIATIPDTENIRKCIALAAPELEAWLIADWDHTFAQDVDFRKDHEGLRWWLSTQKNVPFDTPESFSVYDEDRDTCEEKLSEAIIVATEHKGTVVYRKATHTPRLLQKIDPNIVSKKCPLFKKMYVCLNDSCGK